MMLIQTPRELQGRIPFHNGLAENGQPPAGAGLREWAIDRSLTFLPETLREHGNYSTHMLGKWHLGSWAAEYTPCARGFDTFFGYLGGAEDYFFHNVSQYGCSGLDFVDATPERSTAADMYGGVYSAGLFGDRGAEIIRVTDHATPLFMYLPFQSVHSPVQAPASLIDRYQGKPRPQFMAMVKALDDAIGTLRGALHTAERAARAVWIVTTDNGGCYWSYGNNHPLRGNSESDRRSDKI
jgi:arylsulfatase A-like enzyme